VFGLVDCPVIVSLFGRTCYRLYLARIGSRPLSVWRSGKARIIIKPGQKKKFKHIYRCLHKKLQANNQKNLKKLPNL